MAIELIAPTTDAVAASSVLSLAEVILAEGQACKFIASADDGSAGLATTETVTINITKDGGTTWTSTAETLTATAPTANCPGPGRFKVSKSATASACGVYVVHNGSL